MIITNLQNLFDQILREMEQFEKEHSAISPRHVVEEMQKRLGDKFVVLRKEEAIEIEKLLLAINQIKENKILFQ